MIEQATAIDSGGLIGPEPNTGVYPNAYTPWFKPSKTLAIDYSPKLLITAGLMCKLGKLS